MTWPFVVFVVCVLGVVMALPYGQDDSVVSKLSQKIFQTAFEQAMEPEVGAARPSAPGDGGAALRKALTDGGSGPGSDFINGYLQNIVDDLGPAAKAIITKTAQGTVSGDAIAQRGASPVGAYGYDFFNPGQSADPGQLRAGQSDACTSLEESWLRLCSAPPPSVFLEESVEISAKTFKPMGFPKVSSLRGNIQSSFLEESSNDPQDSEAGPLAQMGNSGKMVLPDEQSEMVDRDKVVLGPRFVAPSVQSLASKSSKILGPSGTKPTYPFLNMQDLFPVAPGNILPMTFSMMREHGTKKLRAQANNMKDSAAVAMMNSKGLKGGLMGMMSPAMGLNYPVVMGPLSRGPEYYDASGPLGPDLPLDTPQGDRCTAMMNTWLYKCNLIPF